MKRISKYWALAFCMALFTLSAVGQKGFSGPDRAALADFQKRIAAYSKLRARIAGGFQKLPLKATPEQIEAHKSALQKALMASRRNARRGDILTPRAAAEIQRIISTGYVGEDRKRLRETVFEAENKTVQVRANAAYPEASELLEMPPSLLLALPKLPKELRWRFVVDRLLLIDSDALLIIDYMTKALP